MWPVLAATPAIHIYFHPAFPGDLVSSTAVGVPGGHSLCLLSLASVWHTLNEAWQIAPL